MVTYNISFNEDLAEVVEAAMKKNKYSSKSEFFRDLVRQMYVKKKNELDIEEIFPGDPDYEEAQEVMKTDEFIKLEDI